MDRLQVGKLYELKEAGQSVWLDYIRRDFIASGDLDALIERGLRGLTSNPTIFHEAVAEGDDYDEQIAALAQAGHSATEIYEALAIEDIQQAADRFLPVYEQQFPVDGSSQNYGFDGYVSLEANPHLADDTAATVDEIQRLREQVDRPNVMYKVPATAAGVAAIAQLVEDGVNINSTLMFSLKHYQTVADAYLTGLERRQGRGESIFDIASVASFFVSRVDSKLDPKLDDLGLDKLKGTIGIANAKSVYQQFTQIFSSARWYRLAQQGARMQRVLWGSTSTKNPDYSDTRYVDNLIGPETVNTMPRATLEAFLDHGTVARTVDQRWPEARLQLEQLEKAGVDLIAVGEALQAEGVDKFVRSYDALIDAIEEKRAALAKAPR